MAEQKHNTNYYRAWSELDKMFKNIIKAYASGNPPESIKDLDINTVRTLYVFARTIKSENTKVMRS